MRLEVAQIRPQLRRMELSRLSTSGSAQQHVLSAIMREVDLEGVTRLKCAEGLTRIWEDTPGVVHSILAAVPCWCTWPRGGGHGFFEY